MEYVRRDHADGEVGAVLIESVRAVAYIRVGPNAEWTPLQLHAENPYEEPPYTWVAAPQMETDVGTLERLEERRIRCQQ